MIEVKEGERTPRGMEESLCSVIEHKYLHTNVGRLYRMIERKVKEWTF